MEASTATAERPAPSREPLLTKFFIFEGSNGLRTWNYLGEQLARDRDHALRLFFPGPAQSDSYYSAVSESAWQPRRRAPKIIETSLLEKVAMPSPGLTSVPGGNGEDADHAVEDPGSIPGLPLA